MRKRFLAQCRNRLLWLVMVLVAVLQGCNPATEESIGPGSPDGDLKPTTEQRQGRRITQARESDTEPPERARDFADENAQKTRREQGIRDPVAMGGEPSPDSEADVTDGNEGRPSVTRMPDHDASELVDALQGEDAVARFLAEEQLVEMGDAAIPALEPLAAAPGISAAREYAINILGEIGTKKAIEVLLAILDREQEPLVRAVVCRHMGRLGVEEAVPVIGRWLYTVQGKSFAWTHYKDNRKLMGSRRPLSPAFAWMEHVYALRGIGGESGIPILETMVKTRHGGEAGKQLMKTYREHLAELNRESEFLTGVRRIPGMESQVKRLFDFFRRDDLAIIRAYRAKVIRGGTEGRWVLEDVQKHPDARLSRAAASLLSSYGGLAPEQGKEAK